MAEQTVGTLQNLQGTGWEDLGGIEQYPGELKGLVGREQYESPAGPYAKLLITGRFAIEAHMGMQLDQPIPNIALVTAGFNELGDDPPEELIGLFTLETQGGGFGLEREIRSLFGFFASSTGALDGILEQTIFGFDSSQSHFGIQSANQLPPPLITASGTVPGVGKLDLFFGFGETPPDEEPFPVFSIEATGIGGSVGRADIRVEHLFDGTGFTGGEATPGPFSGFTITAQGTAEGLASLAEEFFGFTAYGEGTRGNVGRLDVVISPPFVRSGVDYYGPTYLQEVISGFKLTAHSESEDFPPTVAYAVNIKGQAMTQYNHWPFRHVVRFRDKYVAVNASGAYTVGGGEAAGVPFNCEITIPKIDFGVTSVKRLVHLHLTTRNPSRFRVSANPDEHGDIIYYVNADVDHPDIHTNRLKLMKGPRGRYWTVKVETLLGDPFDLDDLELRAQIIHGRRLI